VTAETGRPEPFVVGVWIGIDVGAVRVGVARSDPRARLAVPVATLRRDVFRHSDLEQIARLVEEHEAVGVVIGLPRTLSGQEGPAAVSARAYGQLVAPLSGAAPVVFVDERMTTVIAQRSLSENGVRAKAQRSVIDQAAAVAILQSFLDLCANR
jgi:putative Holliday junction resolvase